MELVALQLCNMKQENRMSFEPISRCKRKFNNIVFWESKSNIWYRVDLSGGNKPQVFLIAFTIWICCVEK